MHNISKFLVLVTCIFILTGCALTSSPGYSDNFLERFAQVVEDDKNPQGQERRKTLYIHRNDTCNDIDKFYRESHDGIISLELAKQKGCSDLFREIKHDIDFSKKITPKGKLKKKIQSINEEYMEDVVEEMKDNGYLTD